VVAESPVPYTVDHAAELDLNANALAAWHARALALAQSMDLPPYRHEKITPDFILDIVKLSYFDQGPLLAQEKLAKSGLPLVILPHLPHTYLDGACFYSPSGRAVVALTLRFDRLDNFWFTLVHELSHVYLHLNQNTAFFDDLETGPDAVLDAQEAEANALTWSLLIPTHHWQQAREALLANSSPEQIIAFAEELQISPAIVAGRIRWETSDFSRFHSLIGNKKVRRLFRPDREEA
jgi:HTH-type transcriptional regulator / antitoxin HigA